MSAKKAPARPNSYALEPVRSAGDHLFAELLVRLAPQGETAILSVHKRARRGLSVEWDRRLGSLDFAWRPAVGGGTDADLVRAAGYALLDVAQRMRE
jgi:hypothetical protein